MRSPARTSSSRPRDRATARSSGRVALLRPYLIGLDKRGVIALRVPAETHSTSGHKTLLEIELVRER